MQLELVDGKGMSITGDDEDRTDQTLDVEPIIIATVCDASDWRCLRHGKRGHREGAPDTTA